MLGGFALFAAMLVIAARTEFVILSFAALGLVSGISAGPIMSLPARTLGPRNESRRHGDIFYDPLRDGCGWPHCCGKIASMVEPPALRSM